MKTPSTADRPRTLLLLTDLIAPRRIKVPLEARRKPQLLEELVGIVARANGVRDADDLLRAVREREAVLSTGIGNGVAIPHGKSSAISELRLAAGSTVAPVDFDALDGRPVRLFFLLVGPETSAGPHIKALSRISRLVRKPAVREQLLAASDPEEFLQALERAEGV